MNVSDVMTRDAAACDPFDSMERAAGLMWDRDCGVVPVVDDRGVVQGVLTDRDVAMSAYLKGRPLATIAVAESMSRDLCCCTPGDTLEGALAAMQSRQVHRMPVVDGEGRLVGMLSLADVLRASQASAAKERAPLVEAIFTTLSVVRAPRQSEAETNSGGAQAPEAVAPKATGDKDVTLTPPAPSQVKSMPTADPAVPATASSTTGATKATPAAAQTASPPKGGSTLPGPSNKIASTPPAKRKKR
jgi:CBS domain-containing protein